ncbi:MAG: hypothetical protein DMG65_18000 [Candidatus Angelobacter sp. Gp1-AA117]|nr:MAG: hypothetical protein DMG65_18000 [Candidatus Angelobacter sp. Gp1-AA117]
MNFAIIFIYQITKLLIYPILCLGLQVAGFAAGLAVIHAVFAQPDIELRLAVAAVPLANAFLFRLVTDATNKIIGHERSLARFPRGRKLPLSSKPASKGKIFATLRNRVNRGKEMQILTKEARRY